MTTLSLLLWLAALLTGCGAEINASETYEQTGLLYRAGDNKPFTGIVVGSSSEGYRHKLCQFKKEYKNGLLEGKSYFYHQNGKIESVEPYQKGVLDGVVTRYYESGQIKSRLHFVNGLRGGARGEMYWNEDGSPQNG